MRRNPSVAIANTLALTALTFIFASSCWAQATEKIIYTFTGGSDGANPTGLVMDSKGNLYGTAVSGGSEHLGVVFELTRKSNGTWSEQVIHYFGEDGPVDGQAPLSGLVFDGKGNLYGTTYGGGLYQNGTVFELSPGPSGSWTYSIPYSFTGGADGGAIYAPLIVDSAGNVYGTTLGGGASGNGTVFELIAGANGTWAEKVLFSFAGGNDGANPYAGPLAFDADKNLYGIVSSGGPHDYGAIFELLLGSNGAWTEKIVHAYTGGTGDIAGEGGVIFDTLGNLYTNAIYSSSELSPGSDGSWTMKSLHNFTGGSDGAGADGGLSFDKTGNLYGTTASGGFHKGTVFELIPNSNGTWTEKILHKFTGGDDGVAPAFYAPTIDANGVVYGTTSTGGASNFGVVFEIEP
jgi:uncharacterized repeat protein (TIGR03803 family)